MEPLRIVLADDHVLFRQGLASLLARRRDIVVVGTADDGLEAIAVGREKMPDVILMDVNMPKLSGVEAVRVITREMPHIRVIMLTIADDDKTLFDAIEAGAAGYLLKSLHPRQLFDMLDGLRRGEAPISGKLAARILSAFQTPAESKSQEAQSNSRDTLTAREKEVLEHVVAGECNKEIAEALSVTENTVKIHLRNILEKLHLKNRIQAAVYAVRAGLADGTQQAK